MSVETPEKNNFSALWMMPSGDLKTVYVDFELFVQQPLDKPPSTNITVIDQRGEYLDVSWGRLMFPAREMQRYAAKLVENDRSKLLTEVYRRYAEQEAELEEMDRSNTPLIGHYTQGKKDSLSQTIRLIKNEYVPETEED